MPEDDPPKTLRPTQRRDLLAALASGFVGALALATSTYNVYLQRQQVRAQVLPILTIEGSFSDGAFSISVNNRGVGPAQVKLVRVSVDHAPTESWMHAEALLLGENHIDDNWSINAVEGQTLSPGQEVDAFRSNRHGRDLLGERRRLAVSVCYCSTLDDCWEVRTQNVFDPAVTVPVPTCIPDGIPFRSASSDLLEVFAHSEAKADGGDAKRDGGD